MPKMQEQFSVQIAFAICRTWGSHQITPHLIKQKSPYMETFVLFSGAGSLMRSSLSKIPCKLGKYREFLRSIPLSIHEIQTKTSHGKGF